MSRTDDLMSRNWQTTTSVALTGASGAFATGVLLRRFPVVTLTTVAVIGALGYTGHRRHNNLPIFPWQSTDATTTTEPTPVTTD